MGVIITRDDIIAYAEVDYIINHMNEKYTAMVPENIRTFFATIREPNYNVKVDPRMPLANQGLKQYTLEIIALLHLKYWCQDEERKNELYDKMRANQLKIEGKLNEQYGIESLFSAEKVVSIKSEEDFSQPKVITRYNQVPEKTSEENDAGEKVEIEKNETEKVEESKENVDTNNVASESNSELTSVKSKENIFTKIKNLIRKLFKKDRSVE